MTQTAIQLLARAAKAEDLGTFLRYRSYARPPSGLFASRELSMKKIILVGFAILAVSTSGALAKKAAKPKAPAAAAATTTGASPVMFGQVSAADRELYKRNQRESGMKGKK